VLGTIEGIAEGAAVALGALVRSGELPARDLVDVAIRRIERLNPALNAVVQHLAEGVPPHDPGDDGLVALAPDVGEGGAGSDG